MLTINNVPLDTRVPGSYISIESSRSNVSNPGMPHRILTLGDKTSAGSAAALQPIRILDSGQGAALFGSGSPLASMLTAARAHNGSAELWAMAGNSTAGSAIQLSYVLSLENPSYGTAQKNNSWAVTFQIMKGGSGVTVECSYPVPGMGDGDMEDLIATAADWAADFNEEYDGDDIIATADGQIFTLTATDPDAVNWTVRAEILPGGPRAWVSGAGDDLSFEETGGDGDGSAAVGSISFAVASPKAGTLSVYIAGQRVATSTLTSDTATTIASRLAAKINATSTLPVSASAAAGVVTLTAKWAGASGNQIDVRLNVYTDEVTPRGVTPTITHMAGGAGAPDINELLAAVGDEWFTAIVMPWADSSSVSAVEAWLSNRYGPSDPKPGHLYVARNENLAGLIAASSARNSEQSSILGVYGLPAPAYVAAAALAGACEYEAELDPARPLQGVRLQLVPPAIPQRFTRDERQQLLNANVSTFTVSSAGEVFIERVVTTRRISALGVPDTTWLDLETKHTLDAIRYAVRVRLATKFPRMKLADDGTQITAGQLTVTPSIIRAELIALARELEAQGLVESVEQFKSAIQVERSQADQSRVNVIFPPDIINQLRVIAGTIEFQL